MTLAIVPTATAAKSEYLPWWTLKPANSIVASEGIGIPALSGVMSRKIPGRPRSPTTWTAQLTIGSVMEARMGIATGKGSVARSMRVWIDLTNSPHVLVLRPVIEHLRARGDEVRVTARDFAQTVGLCERMGIEATVIGHHRGGRVADKAVGLAQRSGALVRWARRHGPFDLALGHGSNDVSVAAALLRIPSATMFDYE